ncbi:MAG: malonyl-CoA synthase [Rhodospirillales bacterium]|nr:malonyl-CoA synthase [Rhodospirillales bacterium]
MSNHFFNAVRAAMPEKDRRFADGPGCAGITYGDMLSATGRLANGLVSLGLKPGDRLAAQTEKCLPALLLYLACVRAGLVYLPLNSAYTRAELDYFLADAEPGLLVCDPDRAGNPSMRALTLDGQGQGSLMDLADSQSEHFSDVLRQEDDLAAILYTSGTTGRSKGAMLTHGNLLSNAQTLADAWRFTQADVLLHALPIHHSHGLFVATNTVLMAGAAMLFLPRFEADLVLDHLRGATVMMGVPTFYTRLLAHPRLNADATRHMRLFISGSAPLLAETHRQWQEKTGHAILERYGLTESNMNSSNPYDGERRPGSVGFPLPGVSLRIDGGEVGMIEVKGPNVSKGYWRNEEKTKAEFKEDGYFITGDLGRIDEDGYVHIVGRAKDLVISGGFNVYPKEVENEIDALPGVLESAVFGVAHPDFGEGVTAAVVPKAGTNWDEAALLDALKERLARFKLPKKLILIDELPRNAMGKVQKNLLRLRFKDLYAR